VLLIAVLALASCTDLDVTRPSVLRSSGPPPGAVPIPPPGPDDPTLAACPSPEDVTRIGVEITLAPEIQNLPLVCRAAEGSVDLTQRQHFVYAALLAMDKLRFTRPLPWTNQSLWGWFSGLRPRILVKTTGNTSCGPCFPGGAPFPGGATLNMLVVTDMPIIWHNIVRFLGTLAHEARHIEVGHHPCYGGRDHRVADMQAFGVHNSVYTWVAEYTVEGIVTQSDRDAARTWACRQRSSAFCNDRCTSSSNAGDSIAHADYDAPVPGCA
jgi:hypothetical protein